MKKAVRIVSLLLVLMLLCSGCGTGTEEKSPGKAGKSKEAKVKIDTSVDADTAFELGNKSYSSQKYQEAEAYYQLADLFTLFHLTFSKKLTTEDYWEQRLNTPVLNSWQGLAFEHVCMVHIRQVRHALGLDKIAVEYYSWRSSTAPRAQVDMIIERADRLVNLCEIKYTQSEYTITSNEDLKVRNRTAAFVRETKTRNGILPTWITPFGLFHNEYSVSVQYQVTLDDLFVD